MIITATTTIENPRDLTNSYSDFVRVQFGYGDAQKRVNIIWRMYEYIYIRDIREPIIFIYIAHDHVTASVFDGVDL